MENDISRSFGIALIWTRETLECYFRLIMPICPCLPLIALSLPRCYMINNIQCCYIRSHMVFLSIAYTVWSENLLMAWACRGKWYFQGAALEKYKGCYWLVVSLQIQGKWTTASLKGWDYATIDWNDISFLDDLWWVHLAICFPRVTLHIIVDLGGWVGHSYLSVAYVENLAHCVDNILMCF